MKRLVIIPTYNEKANISKLVSKLQSLKIENLDILFIDDNSPDGTGKVLKSFQKDNPNLFLIEREGKLGLGTAYIRGFKYGLENSYDYGKNKQWQDDVAVQLGNYYSKTGDDDAALNWYEKSPKLAFQLRTLRNNQLYSHRNRIHSSSYRNFSCLY